MEHDLEFLLTDKFQEFSAKIRDIHQRRTDLKAEFKLKHEQFKADLKALDAEAAEAVQEWECWKSEQKSQE